MKTTIVKFAIIAIVAVMFFSSCSSFHTCAAYSDSHSKGGNTYASRY